MTDEKKPPTLTPDEVQYEIVNDSLGTVDPADTTDTDPGSDLGSDPGSHLGSDPDARQNSDDESVSRNLNTKR